MNLQSGGDAAIKTHNPAYAKLHGDGYRNLAERNEPPALSLDERGVIQDCSKSFETLFGFLHHDLAQQHISMLLPQLTGVELVQAGQLNPLLNYLCRCGHLFHVQNRQGDIFSINLNFVHIGYDGSRFLKMFVRPPCNINA
jgi:PAS domain S-box-containing protein